MLAPSSKASAVILTTQLMSPGSSHNDDKQMKMLSAGFDVSHFPESMHFEILKAWCAYLAPWHQGDKYTQMKISPAKYDSFCFAMMI